MGGNIFKDQSQPIKRENIEPTVKRYFEELKRVFPNKAYIFDKAYFKYVGSVGKKAESGDIDFAIDLSSISDEYQSPANMAKWGLDSDEVKEQFLKYKKRARTATDTELMRRAIMKGIVDIINEKSTNIYCNEKKIGAGGIFTLFPQFTPEGEELVYGVQIDWLIGDLPWLEFSYYSESYDGNVKGLHRTQLLLAMFDRIGYSFSHTKGVVNKETKKVVARTVEGAIKLLEVKYGFKFKEGEINNFFKIIDRIFYLGEEVFTEILDIYFKILDRTRCDIPLGLQDYWLESKDRLGLTGKFLPEDSKLIYEQKLDFITV